MHMPVNGIGPTNRLIYRLEPVDCSAGKTEFDSALRGAVNLSAGDLDSIFEAASKRYNVPANLLKAVAKVESNFNPNATSRCGAMGVMQLMPRTAKWLGVNDAYNAQENIMGGAKYLSQLLRQFDGDTARALAAYNAGPGRVSKAGGVPSFAQGYVDKVMGYLDEDLRAGDAPNSTSALEGSGNSPASVSASGSADRLSTMMLIYQLLMNQSLVGGEPDDRNETF